MSLIIELMEFLRYEAVQYSFLYNAIQQFGNDIKRLLIATKFSLSDTENVDSKVPENGLIKRFNVRSS